ncbi:hypothetical protein [Pseudomonas sp. SST3]|uniref:hypothetical protein n=1 Tax=Pseudomonas sp. SST3 TaxID=2267882 RepID=UPI000DFA1A2C|nr:hypothetical protein [Pseudomonas sp. SST3]NKQ10644.1 hypothetical protein [Pseudomonas sp. SST3]
MVKPTSLGKGYIAEELLRSYFSKSGYYVVRGVPFTYEGFDVTDIDLWLYSRASSVSREITIVDAKNKKTPQAIERIFWAKGLQKAVGATNVIVATTDRRPEVKNFGNELDVVVLDGSFLARLGSREGLNPLRLSDEEFFSRIAEYSLSKLDGDWKWRMRFCKGLLSRGLTFDSCNAWLEHAKFFAQAAIENPLQREIALRCLYFICSLVALTIDYLLKDLAFVEPNERSAILEEGFTYGSRGKSGLKKIMGIALGLVEEHATEGATTARQVRLSVDKQLAALQADILGSYFSRPEVGKNLFNTAKEFEQLSMQRQFTTHSQASTDLKSMFYCLLDHWSIDRTLMADRQGTFL